MAAMRKSLPLAFRKWAGSKPVALGVTAIGSVCPPGWVNWASTCATSGWPFQPAPPRFMQGKDCTNAIHYHLRELESPLAQVLPGAIFRFPA